MLSFPNLLSGHPHSRLSLSTGVIVTYLILGVALLLCNLWAPPMIDDYYFSLRLASVRGLTESGIERASTWYQLLESLGLQWFYDNFRLGNILTRIFMFIEHGKGWLFALLNTVAFLTMISCLAKLVFKNLSAFSLLTTTAFFILFCPAFEPTCLWLAGSLNYLWGACMLSIFLVSFQSIEQGSPHRTRHIRICILTSFLASWFHEALGAGLIGALVCYYLVTHRQKSHIRRYLPLSIIILLMVLSSRSVLGRVAFGSLSTIFAESFRELTFTTLPYVLLVGVLALFRRDAVKRSWRHLIFWFTLLELAMYTYSGGKATWGIAGPAFFPHLSLMICSLYLLRGGLERISTLAATGSGALTALCLSVHLINSHDTGVLYEQARQALRRGETTVVIDQINPDAPIPWMLQASLPVKLSSYAYSYFPYYCNCPPTLFIINRLVEDRTIYSELPEAKTDTIQTMRHGNTMIFRLPSPWVYAGSQSKLISRATTKGKGECCWSEHQYLSWFYKLKLNAIHQAPFFSWAEDYHDGHHYVLFEMPESAQCETMHLRIVNRNNTEERVIAVPVSCPAEVNINDPDRIESVRPKSIDLPWLE